VLTLPEPVFGPAVITLMPAHRSTKPPVREAIQAS
jgi:hypothetical protein